MTGAQTEGATKLIAVVEMATYVDDTIASAAQEALQKPMAKAVEKMTKFISTFLESLQSAQWLQPSEQLDGACYSATIQPNANQPFEKMNIDTSICYDGTSRVISQQQSIVRT